MGTRKEMREKKRVRLKCLWKDGSRSIAKIEKKNGVKSEDRLMFS